MSMMARFFDLAVSFTAVGALVAASTHLSDMWRRHRDNRPHRRLRRRINRYGNHPH